ncbi:MAG: hypothetical protein TUN42_00670 [Dehalogenimonas sp.]
MEVGHRLVSEAYKVACRIEQIELRLSGLDLRDRDSLNELKHPLTLELIEELANLKQIFYGLIEHINLLKSQKAIRRPYAAI